MYPPPQKKLAKIDKVYKRFFIEFFFSNELKVHNKQPPPPILVLTVLQVSSSNRRVSTGSQVCFDLIKLFLWSSR